MNTTYAQPSPGHYRRARNIRLVGEMAICSYPLRVIRLSTTAARLLLLCEEERTYEELVQQMSLPVARLKVLCEQLRWKGLLEAGPPRLPAFWPSVSIIIPTRNRESQLEQCMRSLLNLEYPGSHMEVIVVDDASTNEVATFLQPFIEEFETRNIRVQIIRNPRQQGVAICRNIGADAAQFEILAYIDSDCVASPMWLRDLVPVLEDASVGAVGGMIRAYERESMLGRYEDIRSSLFMGLQEQQVRLEGPLTYLATANLLVRRTLWQKIGGFAPLTFGEDVDFCRHLLIANLSIAYVPRGVVYHDNSTNMWPFLKIRASYASAEAALLRRHPNERRILVLPPEQATFAGLVIGGMWGMMLGFIKQLVCKGYGMKGEELCSEGAQGKPTHQGDRKGTPLPYTEGSDTPFSCIVGALLSRPCGRPGGCGRSGTHHGRSGRRRNWGRRDRAGAVARYLLPLLSIVLAILLTIFSVCNRMRKVKKQQIPLSLGIVVGATLRGHLMYTYHLCRHLTRYYTLPMLLVGLMVPPLLILLLLLCSIVVVVDYMRLKPYMNLGQYALCSLLDDCAYEVGVVIGCVRHRTWKPLLPVIRGKNP